MWEQKVIPAVQTITHITQNARYRVVIERAASTKGVLGFKVEANGDELSLVVLDAQSLKLEAEKMTQTEIVNEKGI